MVLGTTERPLAANHDVAMLDLDGVVYRGAHAVPHAAEAIAAAREAGIRVAFITNNASRTPDEVAAHIAETGVPVTADEVVSSAQAAAHLLRDAHGEGAVVLMLGARGLEQALKAKGLVPTTDVEADVVSLVTGYGPDVVWSDIMRAANRIKDGLPWVATNTDMTLPVSYGVAPGHGAFVALLRDFSGKEPVVAGKPARPLLAETEERTGAEWPLMVGDRLDTDIAGANDSGMPSLLVLTGVTEVSHLVSAPPRDRPTYISADLRGLNRHHKAPKRSGDGWFASGWTAQVEDGVLVVTGSGDVDDWWAAVAVAGWEYLDATGSPVDFSGLTPPSEDAVAG